MNRNDVAIRTEIFRQLRKNGNVLVLIDDELYEFRADFNRDDELSLTLDHVLYLDQATEVVYRP